MRELSPRDACQRFVSSFDSKPVLPVVRLTKAVHVAAFAPTSVGKGASLVIPHLLTSPYSTVVVDVKRENYTLTAKARRRIGHRVVVLDP